MANTRYENFIIANKMAEVLNTNKDLKNYMTIDNTLTESAGMKKKVNTYSVTGDVADVTEGKGNTTGLTMSYTAKEYDVVTTQGKFTYTDEDEMTDPYLVDKGVESLTKKLVNALNTKAITAAMTTTNKVEADSFGFDAFVDALALLNKESASEIAFTAFVNPNMAGILRKALKDDLKYSEDYVRTGYIGTVAGVPVVTCKLIADNTILIYAPDAVTTFIKKDAEVEQDRDPNTRTNTVYGRMVLVCALTDESECVKIVKKTTQTGG